MSYPNPRELSPLSPAYHDYDEERQQEGEQGEGEPQVLINLTEDSSEDSRPPTPEPEREPSPSSTIAAESAHDDEDRSPSLIGPAQARVQVAIDAIRDGLTKVSIESIVHLWICKRYFRTQTVSSSKSDLSTLVQARMTGAHTMCIMTRNHKVSLGFPPDRASNSCILLNSW